MKRSIVTPHRRKRAFAEPPHEPAPVPIDLRETRDSRLFNACFFCDGSGIDVGSIELPWATACNCTSGRRIVCAIPEGSLPLPFEQLARVAERIGLGTWELLASGDAS